MIALKYLGAGEWVPGVPASDHEQADDALAAELIATGLYEADVKETKKKPAEGGE